MNSFDLVANKIIEDRKSNFIVFLITLVCLTVFMLVYNSPPVEGHDFLHHWNRLEGLIQALRDGTFPWYVNYNGLNGTGYFVKAFYCDLSLLPFAVIGLFTNVITAYYSLIVITTLLCGLITYYCVRRMYNNLSVAFLGAILYTFCTYRLYDFYTRAAIAEAITFTLVPLVFLGVYEVTKGDYKKWYILAISYSLVIFTHLLTSVILIIPIIIFMGINYKFYIQNPRRILYMFISAIVTILLSSYFIFPMLEQMNSNTFYYETRGAILEKGLHQTEKLRMILSGFIQGTMQKDELHNTKIGALISVGIFMRLFVKNRSNNVKRADILFIVSLIIIFMTSNMFPWKIFPFTLFNVMQFSWRLLIFPSLFMSIAGAIYLSETIINNRKAVYIYGIFILFSGIVIHIEKHNSVYDYRYRFSTNSMSGEYGSAEYLPDAVPSIDFINGLNIKNVYKKELSSSTVTNYGLDKGVVSFDLNNNDAPSNKIVLPVVYYKGYVAKIDDTEIEPKESKEGLIELDINGSGKVIVSYASTLIQKISTIISLISSVLLFLFVYTDRWTKNHQKLKAYR